MRTIEDFGCFTSIELINQFVSLDGKCVVDAGCGNMTFTLPLIQYGARVLAIDPDPVQAELNRAADPIAGLEFIETGAEQIPVEDGTVDGIFFSYSLHHIPAAIYPELFAEVTRILRPDGFLFVIEPTSCPLNDILKLFHDEDQVRAAAQEALERFAVPAFQSLRSFAYHSFTQYASFEHFAEHYIGRSYNMLYTAADVRSPKVKAAFERHGPSYRFQSPKQAMFLQGLRSQT